MRENPLEQSHISSPILPPSVTQIADLESRVVAMTADRDARLVVRDEAQSSLVATSVGRSDLFSSSIQVLEDSHRYLERVGGDLERATSVMHKAATLDHRLRDLSLFDETTVCLSLPASLTRDFL